MMAPMLAGMSAEIVVAQMVSMSVDRMAVMTGHLSVVMMVVMMVVLWV